VSAQTESETKTHLESCELLQDDCAVAEDVRSDTGLFLGRLQRQSQIPQFILVEGLGSHIQREVADHGEQSLAVRRRDAKLLVISTILSDSLRCRWTRSKRPKHRKRLVQNLSHSTPRLQAIRTDAVRHLTAQQLQQREQIAAKEEISLTFASSLLNRGATIALRK
jgi:hypothetical protein